MGPVVQIFHITHIQNLPKIIEAGGLRCDRDCTQSAVGNVNIAHLNIKERRMRRPVPCAARGVVADYVPFYFAPRSPMLYTIRQGNVEGYEQGQRPIVYLVSTVEDAVSLGRPWCFTDGHAEIVISRFFDSLTDLSNVDWAVMNAKYWNDTPDAPDRKRRRQAEFLVHEFFPWTAIGEIAVMDAGMMEEVLRVLGNRADRPSVLVKKSWYYA
jgi:hypothetical protein